MTTGSDAEIAGGGAVKHGQDKTALPPVGCGTRELQEMGHGDGSPVPF